MLNSILDGDDVARAPDIVDDAEDEDEYNR